MEHDPILEAAERDLSRLDAQRQEIADFIARYRKYKAALPASAVVGPAVASVIPPRSSRVDEVMSAVCDVLIKRDDAMSLSDLFDALIKQGVVIGGRNPKQNLSQKLSHDERLKSYGRHGWYFADTIPQCLGGRSRLDGNQPSEHEEGPATEMARPLQSNGATDSYSEAPRG